MHHLLGFHFLSSKCMFIFTVTLAIYHLTTGPQRAQHAHFGLLVFSRGRTTHPHYSMTTLQQMRFQKCLSLKKATFNFMCATWSGGGGGGVGWVLPWMWGHSLGDRLSTVSQVRAVQACLGMQGCERWELAMKVSLLCVGDLAACVWGSVGLSP